MGRGGWAGPGVLGYQLIVLVPHHLLTLALPLPDGGVRERKREMVRIKQDAIGDF